jgi:hypothetical protein
VSANQLTAFREVAANALGNQVELRDARMLVSQALPERLGVENWACDVLAMTADDVVFYAYGEPSLRGFHQIKYSVSNEGKVTFTGDPEPVNLMTRIMPRQTVDVNSGQPQQQEVSHMANENGQGGNQPTPAAGAEATGNAPAAPNAAPTVEASAAPVQEQTVEQFLASAPAGIREVLQSGMTMVDRQRTALITKIKANSKNKFSDDQLKGFDLGHLEALAELAEPPADYRGRAANSGSEIDVNQAGPSVSAGFAPVPGDYLTSARPQGNA